MRINVAVGIVRNQQGQFLVARRHNHQHQGGLWEFPGGKIEANELAEQGLARELYEEVGVTVRQAQAWQEIIHDYVDKQVRLKIFLVTQFEGVAQGKEQQLIKWVSLSALQQLSVPEANKAIIEGLVDSFSQVN